MQQAYPDGMTIDKRLGWREFRERSGIGMNEMARRTGIFKGDLSRIENGRVVPMPWEADAIVREARKGK